MSYCINPSCSAPAKNSNDTNFCITCNAPLRLQDRYRAQQLLGQGGFGKTFKAIDEEQSGQPLCVIKQFAYRSSDPKIQQTALNLFYKEAKHLESLGGHPQIPELLAYFDVDGQPYLVQKYIDGQDLQRELATEGRFNQQQVRELLNSLLPVLDFLHNQPKPLIHRDIKPANIIRRNSDRTLVLVDFGAAKQATQTMLAKTGTMIGSPEFAAPEQTRGKPIFASDIYSLGVTCIHLLTNIPPFDLFDTGQDNWVWRDYLVDNPVDKLLGEILDKSIVNAVVRRYSSASEVLAALGSVNKLPAVVKDIAQPKSHSLLAQLKLESFTFETAQLLIKKGFLGQTKEIIVQKSVGKANRFVEDLGNGIQLEMIAISAGEFLMGSPRSERGSFVSERPQKQLELSNFYLGRYPITQIQYQALMGINRSTFKGDNLPIEQVSWHDAQAFCEKLTRLTKKRYRLPSEAEWEYACRAGTTTPFYFGQMINSTLVNYRASDTKEVGSFPANNFGLCEMHGNVGEWCEDHWYDNYEKLPNINSKWIDKNTIRGGSWSNTSYGCRSAVRYWGVADLRDSNIGFRVICS